MPSPTSSTRPTLRASMPAFELSISLARTETISLTFNAITAPLDELVADRAQPGAHAGVVAPVADLDRQPAQEVGAHRLVQDGLQRRHRPHVVGDAPPLLVGERQDGL